MDGDEEEMALGLILQANADMKHIVQLISHSSSLKADAMGREDLSDSTSEEEEGPGCGYTANDEAKATYYRRGNTSFYQLVRELDPDVALFSKITHLSRTEFDLRASLAGSEPQKPTNVRQTLPDHVQATRIPRKRILSCTELLFFLFDEMSGANEGRVGCERTGLKYGLSVGTVSNYFRHALLSLYQALDAIEPPLIEWPCEQEREAIEGLIVGFPKCVFLVDGNKNKRWRPKDNAEQEHAYDGYKHTHAFSVIAFCDIFGAFIRIEVSNKGAESDRNLYTGSPVYQSPAEYLSPGQHGMADMGFAGDGDVVVPYKRNESTDWMYRVEHNRDIRKQRMVNEWGIGFIYNRYRLFLGRWPFSPDLFPIAYKTVSMLANWQFRNRGYSL